MDRVVDRVVEVRESLFPQFAGLGHHRIERFRVYLLVEGLQRAHVEPVTHVHHVLHGQVLPLRRPLPTVGMKVSAVERLETRKLLGAFQEVPRMSCGAEARHHVTVEVQLPLHTN